MLDYSVCNVKTRFPRMQFRIIRIYPVQSCSLKKRNVDSNKDCSLGIQNVSSSCEIYDVLL